MFFLDMGAYFQPFPILNPPGIVPSTLSSFKRNGERATM
ncbi:hypothetical protein D187_008614 [Cystobacter fuscus DSM 2262]|uniref:Uncharacterized protein n=1 Tax=Cystobacter fuscus (strain ATCC 25194 / DSM 2262 / NBRC 100088 / M29) TaxID=1242864 RepID=S9PH64_CYSF2|nr:hypothetical protein D187_008614 [Cystobacter fuscus DSM 2262]